MPVSDVEVIAPNLKIRLSGVTSTIIQLVPRQAEEIGIAVVGAGLPRGLPRIPWWKLPLLLGRPRRRAIRIWHARRNVEMLAGLVLKSVLRAPLKLVFTSAAQRRHTLHTRFLISRMDGVIATSRLSGRYLTVPHTVVMHGVDCERFHPPAAPEDGFERAGLPGRYAIGCFGRIRHQKGTDLFVDAMLRLLPDFPDWTAVVAGRVTRRHRGFHRRLRDRIARSGLERRIVFVGELPDPRLWYRRLTLHVSPARTEGFGLTPLEAMASRSAVVASDAGAHPELIVEGETGAVVPAGDGDALAEAIARYMREPELALAHGRNGREHVRRSFSLDREVNGIHAVYRRLWREGS
ncbi:MAG: glycosyltransferase family 4 protein [Defluviicoccus sp.]|nr:glycosyltransferase family 4 protein [Defluviicoccus sp.]MDE0383952.1 glycosyltransferase family 4 protein [Defluviicoccus sp.]